VNKRLRGKRLRNRYEGTREVKGQASQLGDPGEATSSRGVVAQEADLSGPRSGCRFMSYPFAQRSMQA
jgi:hypothetical protein